MYNLPLDELMDAINHALHNGYTICWDGDVSEQGFSYKNGIAINPQVEDVKDYSTTDRARLKQCLNTNAWKKYSSLNILILKST